MSDFKALKKEWERKLRESGFIDIENHNQQLIKRHTHPTQRQLDANTILNFFLALDSYLVHNQDTIPPIHRIILANYSAGLPLLKIKAQSGYSIAGIKLVIKKYKKIILSQNLD